MATSTTVLRLGYREPGGGRMTVVDAFYFTVETIATVGYDDFYVGSTPLLVARLTVAAGGGLDGLAMGDLSARTRVVAIGRAAEEGRLEHPPRRGTRFRAGDQAYLLGPYEELLQVLRRDTLSPSQVAAPFAIDR